MEGADSRIQKREIRAIFKLSRAVDPVAILKPWLGIMSLPGGS